MNPFMEPMLPHEGTAAMRRGNRPGAALIAPISACVGACMSIGLFVTAACAPGSAAAGKVVAPRTPGLLLEEAPEIAEVFRRERAQGAVVLWDSRAERPRCYGGGLCLQRFLPASTFKIPSSLIALETKTVSGPDHPLRWDGKKRVIPTWNRDHQLRTAMRDSVVWYYQALARSVGERRLAEWVRRLGYGNQCIEGGVDRFWLDGALRISPAEQVQFLRRLHRSTLPASAWSQAVVRDLMLLERGPGWAWRGKTGWALRSRNVITGGSHPEVGWMVGWVERGSVTIYYALLVTERPVDVKMWDLRRRLIVAVLEQVGALPRDRPRP